MKKFCIIIMLTVFFISCGNSSPKGDENRGYNLSQEDRGNDGDGTGGSILPQDYYTFNQTTHQSQKAAWESLGIDHYQFTGRNINHSFAPLDPFTVIVTPGKESVIILNIPKTHPLYHHYEENPVLYTYGRNIPEIFAYMEQQAANLSPGREITIVYNEEYHYPQSFSDHFTIPGINGSSLGFEITTFENLGE